MLGVSCIWVKALTKTHHRILSKIGADRVIEPEQEIGKHVAQKLHNPLIRDYLSLGNGSYIVDMHLPERLDGETLGTVLENAGKAVRCLGVMRGTEFLSSDSKGMSLKTDDKLLLLGPQQDLRDYSENLL